LRRRNALIFAENVLYSRKMSKTAHPSRSPVGSVIFRVVSEEHQPGT
jgi:hypothetical protein